MNYLLCSFLLLSFFMFGQRQEFVDFKKVHALISIDLESKKLTGESHYVFELLGTTDSVFLNAKNMVVHRAFLDGKRLKLKNLNGKLIFKAPKETGMHGLQLEFECSPRQTVYFTGSPPPGNDRRQDVFNIGSRVTFRKSKKSNVQVWTQGQGKYTSHWLPSLDDMNDKMEFDFIFEISRTTTVIANGKLQGIDSIPGFRRAWRFNMERPMSSYLAAFAIGDFDKKIIWSDSGIPMELYYRPQNEEKVEPTYRYSKKIFDFLEKEIGVDYPWQNYKQVPVQDFLYAGMENVGCTIFSDQYVIDSIAFVDKNYVNVNAHELAHQWFGNLVTEESGAHHWLHEGFATYYAYLSEKEIFGDDFFYWKLLATAKTLHTLSENGDGEALTDPGAGSVTFYEKGAWALAMLRKRLGAAAFKEGIRRYLMKYAFKNATITDFLAEMEAAGRVDLSMFKKEWLQNEIFPWEEAKNFLIENEPSIATYFEVRAAQEKGGDIKQLVLESWHEWSSEGLKIQIIHEFVASLLSEEFFKKLEGESIKVRQAMVMSTDTIPVALREGFESFLHDASYRTQELALVKLWKAFPEGRIGYLEVLDGAVGLPDRNIRLPWLTLALVTDDFQKGNKGAFYEELVGYTSPHFNFEVRQLAFQYLFGIGGINTTVFKNLLKGASHHVWQFKKSCRNLIRDLYRSEGGKARLKSMRPELSEEEQQQLNTILNL